MILAEKAEHAGQSSDAIRTLGARAALAVDDKDRAVHFLGGLRPLSDSASSTEGWLLRAELCFQTGFWSQSCDIWQHLSTSRHNVTAQRSLARLLSGCGLAEESLPHWLNLLRTENADAETLICLATGGQLLYPEDFLQRILSLVESSTSPFGASCADDRYLPLTGLIRHAVQNRDQALAERLCAEARSIQRNHVTEKRGADFNPDWPVWLKPVVLQVLLRQDGSPHDRQGSHQTGLDELHAFLAVHEEFVEAWLLAAREHSSVRCAVEALRRSPWNADAGHLLSDLLYSHDVTAATELRALADRLKLVRQLAVRLYQSDGAGLSDVRHQLVQHLLGLGRTAEARAWARLELRTPKPAAWAVSLLTDTDSLEAEPYQHPLLRDPSRFNIFPFPAGMPQQSSADDDPIADRPPDQPSTDVSDKESSAPSSRFWFDDVADEVGLHFRYNNGVKVGQEGLLMHQWTGGGVGVLDLDADLWPDLCFPQGGRSDSDDADGLYRNLMGRQYVDVSTTATSALEGFGQGVAVGDVNNDGFDDVYLPRVGQNQLLINQGDGTFTVSRFSVMSAETGDGVSDAEHADLIDQWTTSAAVADLNGDGAPDLYDVNYVTGNFRRTCRHDGYQRICGPTDFPAAVDVVWLSDAAGGFTAIAVEQSPDAGRGMGLVVGDYLSRGTNQVYVTNDETGNRLFEYSPNRHGFSDITPIVGGAGDQFGAAQGSMGIAIGDTDADGRADLFVTNYYSESNTLYQQPVDGVLIDATPAADLAVPGFEMLGFGCQFADFNSDGFDDLLVSNGHLDDFQFRGHPYRMRAQLFAGTRSGRFVEQHHCGPYFDREVLGRSVAVLDWNRDGFADAVVTHLDSPTALLCNRSSARLRETQLVLIGTSSSRDAIGATVVDTARDRTVAWQTAGSGYQCSSQNCVRIRCADSADTVTITVAWPPLSLDSSTSPPKAASGSPSGQNVRPIDGRRPVLLEDRESAVVEGRRQAYRLPR
ncbi:MAG: CRTAC1 family protein [Planctomycetaceae bacterium]|nr:CRTAC1 family protein [Planctomycetaceae bacterium]